MSIKGVGSVVSIDVETLFVVAALSILFSRGEGAIKHQKW